MLQLTLLGRLQLQIDQQPPLRLVSQRAELMVVYLAMTKQMMRREKLATLLWDDRTQAQSMANLRSLLARLPKAVKAYLTITHTTVQFSETATVQSDVERCLEAIQAAKVAADDAALEAALTLFTGAFLDGVIVEDSEGLALWISSERERIHQLIIEAHETLCQTFLAKRELEKGITVAQRLLQLDELRERPYQLLMELYGRKGEREKGLQIFAQCQQMLADNFGLSASLPVVKLAERLRRQTAPPPYFVPGEVTPFIGHQQLLRKLKGAVSSEARLLSLVGYGGEGKTRLAIALAKALKHQFWDGIFFVDLSGIEPATNNALPLLRHTAVALNLIPREGRAIEKQLLDFLREKEMLLIFDNFEPFIASSAPFLQQLRQEATALRLVVTSRERLNLRAETVISLNGLSFPSDADSAESALQTEALTLFQSCAKRQACSVSLSPKSPHLADVVHICQALEGNPLGIELIATSLTPTELAHLRQKFDSRLAKIAATQIDYPDRHKSLAAVFDYSWHLLSPVEQHLLAKLSIFRGRVKKETVAQLVTVSEQRLQGLVNKSLLGHFDEDSYALHPLIRQFAAQKREQLFTKIEEAALWEAYGRAFLAVAADYQTAIEAGKRVSGEINHILENILAAWQWAVENAPADLLQRTVPTINDLFTQFHLSQQGLQIVQDGLRRAAKTANGEQLLPAFILQKITFLCNLEQYDEVQFLVDSAGELALQQEDWAMAAAIQLERTRPLEINGRFEAAHSLLNEVIALCREHKMLPLLSQALHRLGHIYRRQSLNEEALHHFQDALDIAIELNRKKDEATIKGDMGIVYTEMSDYENAIRCHEAALSFAKMIHHEEEVAKRSNNMGLLYWKQNELDKALRHYQDALAIAEKLGIQRGIAISATNAAIIHKHKEAYQEALSIYNYALQAGKAAGDIQTVMMCLGNMGNVHKILGNFDSAESCYLEAIKLSDSQPYPATLARHLGQLAELFDFQGRSAEAKDYFDQAAPLMNQYGSPYDQCWFWVAQAQFLYNCCCFEEAAQRNEAGRQLANRIAHREICFASDILHSKLLTASDDQEAAVRILQKISGDYSETRCQAAIHFELWQNGVKESFETAVTLNKVLYQKTKNITYKLTLEKLLATSNDLGS